MREVVALCHNLCSYNREMVSVVGTRVQGNNRDRNFTPSNKPKGERESADEYVKRYMKEMDESDTGDSDNGSACIAERDREFAALREWWPCLVAHRETGEQSGKDQLAVHQPGLELDARRNPSRLQQQYRRRREARPARRAAGAFQGPGPWAAR